jgi:hypothetical protein
MKSALYVLASCAAMVTLGVPPTALAESAAEYRVSRTVPLGAPDRWDYVVFDSGSGRVFVAHGDEVVVVDGESGEIAGRIKGFPGGTHGIAISKVIAVTPMMAKRARRSPSM